MKEMLQEQKDFREKNCFLIDCQNEIPINPIIIPNNFLLSNVLFKMISEKRDTKIGFVEIKTAVVEAFERKTASCKRVIDKITFIFPIKKMSKKSFFEKLNLEKKSKNNPPLKNLKKVIK